MVYHVLNRANARAQIFARDADYEAFEKVLAQAVERTLMRMLSYCLMPNHWHLLLWPRQDGELSKFMHWLTVTHTQRWHAHHDTSGTGHLYQGRFKSFPVQTDDHFLTVCRYVERNALRAGLVGRAEQWRWSSLWRRVNRHAKGGAPLVHWPVDPPRNWLALVNQPQHDENLKAVRHSVVRGAPFGSRRWQSRIAKRLRLESTLRPRGRPRTTKTKRL